MAWRKKRLWGVSNRLVADRAEELAMQTTLPKSEFTGLAYAPAINQFFPFDLMATYKDRRVLIDVNTRVGRMPAWTGQDSLTEALKMSIFVLFVKPDFSKYQLTPADGSKTTQMHVSELVAIE